MWRVERERFENDSQTLTRDLRYMKTRFDEARAMASKRDGEAATERDIMKGQLAEARKELKAVSERSLDGATKSRTMGRKVDELVSSKAALQASFIDLQTSSEAALVSEIERHACEVRLLRKDLTELRSAHASVTQAVGLAASVAATRSESSATEMARLSSEARVALEQRDDALAALSELSSTVHELRSLREENAKLCRNTGSAAAAYRDAVVERDKLRDGALGWDALFKREGGVRDAALGWDALFKREGGAAEGSAEPITALHVYSDVVALRDNEFKLTKELGASEAGRKELESKVSVCTCELVELRAAQAKDRRCLDALGTEARTLKSLVAVKDQALLRRQELLESYEANESKPGRRSDDQRLEKERLVEDELRRTKEALADVGQAAARDNAKLERQLEKAQCEVAALIGAVARGEVVAPGVKVLHMRDNPSAEAARQRKAREVERVDQLERENSQLKAKIESASFATGVASSSLSSCGGGGEVFTPNKEPTSQIVNQRLKEMFRKNVEQLKSAVMSLFGFELIFSPGSAGSYNVKCRSVYSESEEQVLLFQWTGASGDGMIDTASPLQLMSTPFALQVQQDRPQIFKIYLHTFASLPLFLGEVQRYLFESTTQFTQGP